MTTTILYLVYIIASVIGITTLIAGLINGLYRLLGYKNVEILYSFLTGFTLWVGLTYLWKVIDGRQMPQIAIILCIIALALNFMAVVKFNKHQRETNLFAGSDDTDSNTLKVVFSQIGSLIIIFIASFFIYHTIRWT